MNSLNSKTTLKCASNQLFCIIRDTKCAGSKSYGSQRKNSLHESVAFKNHLFAHSGRPELLEGFTCNRRKVLPGRHWPEELHKSKPTDKLRPAGCQVKCQRGSPVLRYDEC